jgi:PIN domain nuclease of toxin-antitoxin system
LRLLLDTHALLWWFSGESQMSAPARKAIGSERNDILVSAATAWEIATKHRLGKLPDATPLAMQLEARILDQGFLPLSITLGHALAAGALPGPNRNPFDRMIVAQAMIDDLAIVSNEEEFDSYGVKRVW